MSRHAVARMAGRLACTQSRALGSLRQFDFFDYGDTSVPSAPLPSSEIPTFDEFGYGLQDVQSIPITGDTMMTFSPNIDYGQEIDAGTYQPNIDYGQSIDGGAAPESAPWYAAIPWDAIGKTAASLITAGAPVAAKIYAASQGAPTSAPVTSTVMTAAQAAAQKAALPNGYGYSPSTGQIMPIPQGATLDARGVIVPADSGMNLTSMLPYLAIGGAVLFMVSRRR